MSSAKRIIGRRHAVYALALLASGAVLAANSIGLPHIGAQSANSIYVTPASGTYTTGSSFTVSVRVNTSTSVNAAEAEMSYSSNLEFVSIDGSGSAYGIDASSSGGNGSVSISRATITPVSGDQLLSKVTFKVLSAGAGVIGMNSGSQALDSSTNANVIQTRNGGAYTLQAPASPSPAPSPTPTPAPAPAPAPVSKPVGSTGTGTTSSKPATTIAPQGNPSPTPLPGDSEVELQAPATVETTTDGSKQVVKVEYLINGKLVKVDDTPPYSQSLDIKHMRNGTYKLTTKTYYKDGKIDSSTASLVVNNPFGLYQLWLQLKHFAWLVVILLIVIGELVYIKFFRNRNHPGAGLGADGTSGGYGQVVVGGSGGAAGV